MNDDDLLGSTLSPVPATAPLVSRAIPLAAVVLVVGAAMGCNPGDPPLVYDAGLSAPDSSAPGVDGGVDAGRVFDAGISPPDAGTDSATPGVDAGSPPDTGVDSDVTVPPAP